ncbi:hypothetical protein [Hoeflea halophila]|nr:hypothetical protein [Hoeflea halophila]
MIEPITARMPCHQQLRAGEKLGFKARRAKLHLFDAGGNSYRFTHPAS